MLSLKAFQPGYNFVNIILLLIVIKEIYLGKGILTSERICF